MKPASLPAEERHKNVVTMRDIARRAGVAMITVSRALNPATAAHVKAATRARIERVARSCGYRVNQFARALRSGRGRTFVLVLPASPHFASSEYYAHVVFCVVSAAHDAGYDVKVHVMRAGEATGPAYDEMGMDGIIVAGFSDAQALVQQAGATPLVLLSSVAVPGACSVDADNVHGGQLAAEHLLAFGHRSIGVLAGPPYSTNAVDRLTGFRDALARQGIRLPKNCIVSSEFGVEEGRRAARLLLRRTPRLTALFCANDELAIGALQSARALGLNCPADVSIIGFDNINASLLAMPPLTTIEQPIAEMSVRCVATLLELLAGHAPQVRQLLPVRLVTRASVAAPPTSCR